MSASCQLCSAPAPAGFLCKHCQGQLRQNLADLPWWLGRLAEAAVGQAKLGDGGHYTPADRLVRYTDPIDGDEALQRDLAAGKFLLDRALAAGRVNARAARLLNRIGDMLAEITQKVGKLDSNAIATHPDAGQWYLAIQTLIGDPKHDGEIARVINRPIPWRWLGKCPTWVEDKHAACGTELRCRQDAVEVYCHACHQTHNPDRLQLLLMNDLEREKMPLQRMLEANRMLPEDYRVSERTLRWWRQHGKLKVRGFLRPCSCGWGWRAHRRKDFKELSPDCVKFDGREAPTWHSDDDEPLYLWADIRKLRAEGKVLAE